MAQDGDNTTSVDNQHPQGAYDAEQQDANPPHSSKLVRFYAHPWTQIVLISFICFCLPGVRSQDDHSSRHG